MTIQPVYGGSEVRFVAELRDVEDPPLVTGSDVGLVVSPKGLSPCLNDHCGEVFDQVVTGTVHDQVVVKTFGSSSFQHRHNRQPLPITTGSGTIDLFVQDIKEMTEVPRTVLRGQCNPVASSVVIEPNPLFEGQGDTERVVPVIGVDPVPKGSLYSDRFNVTHL